MKQKNTLSQQHFKNNRGDGIHTSNNKNTFGSAVATCIDIQGKNNRVGKQREADKCCDKRLLHTKHTKEIADRKGGIKLP